jgi:hypothetical protein
MITMPFDFPLMKNITRPRILSAAENTIKRIPRSYVIVTCEASSMFFALIAGFLATKAEFR